ncbi:hypothetical protein EMCRGX_G032898 [Ephydatia muelleri]
MSMYMVLAKIWDFINGSKDRNVYETTKSVNEYMAFHYTPPSEYIAQPFCPKEHLDFPLRCAELCIKHKNQDVKSRALDIGCAVGRASFELARAYQEVVAIDYSSAFVNVCQDLKAAGEKPYILKTEGDLGESKIAKINPNIDRTRVVFSTGDAGNLGDIGQFGCVLAANLVCRMKEPAKFMNSLHDLVIPGGIVVLTTPLSWSEEFSSKEKWLGGYMKNDQEVCGLQTIKEIMLQHFELLEEPSMPFVIRETVNKYHWVCPQTTVWRRNV